MEGGWREGAAWCFIWRERMSRADSLPAVSCLSLDQITINPCLPACPPTLPACLLAHPALTACLPVLSAMLSLTACLSALSARLPNCLPAALEQVKLVC